MNISVYISSYNQIEYLRDAINSVLNQTLKPFEILIIDDCSSDGSQELIKSFASEHSIIKFILHEKNIGISCVRSEALSNIKGDLVTYLDGDDIYLPNKLEKELKLLENGKYDLSFTNNMYVNPDNIDDIKWIWGYNLKDFPKPGTMFIETLTRAFPRQSLFRMELVKTELYKKTGYYDNNLKIYEDYDLRIRLAKEAKINFSVEPTTKIRISKFGLSKSNASLHYESYKYIFDKYSDIIENLPLEEKKLVKKRLNTLLNKKRTKLKDKIEISKKCFTIFRNIFISTKCKN